VEARRNFNVSPQAALEPYLKLETLAAALEKAQPAAEDAAPHLIDHVNQAARSLWKQMKDNFARDFEKTLTKMGWPGENLNLTETLEQEWQTGVEKLLDLQEPYVKTPPSDSVIEIIHQPQISIYLLGRVCPSACFLYFLFNPMLSYLVGRRFSCVFLGLAPFKVLIYQYILIYELF
jgi:hypothetical protein